MFSNIYQPWTYLKTRDIIAEVQFVMFTDCKKHGSAGALIHRQQTIYWIFTQTKLSSTNRHKRYCHLLGIDKTSNVAYNSGETQTCNYFFVYFSVAIDSGEILANVWQEEGNYISKYIQLLFFFLLCYGKAVNLQHMWKVEWSNVELL